MAHDSTAAPRAITYRPDIDGLRAVAVTSVMLFHAGFERFGGGFVGVDVFFVISGFLITRLILREIETTGRFRFGRFYLRRARRLLPALYATLALSTLFGALLLSPPHLERFSESLIGALFSVSNMVFWLDAGYFAEGAEVRPLLHTWSLGVEEQFYLLWPACLLLFVSRCPRGVMRIVCAIIVVSLAGNRLFAHGLPDLWPVGEAFADGAATIFYLLPFRAFELAIGALMVWVLRARPLRGIACEAALLAGLGMIAFAVSRFDATLEFPSFNALLPCLGAALALMGGHARWCGVLLRNPVSVGIGIISYSLYLVHWPILVYCGYWKYDTLDTGEASLALALSVLAALTLYRLVERPLRYLPAARGSESRPNRRFLAGLALASLAFVVLAVQMRVDHGWRWRIADHDLPDELWKQVKLEDKFHEREYGGAGYPQHSWFGAARAPADVVLLGDSHALHYAAGLDMELARPAGLSVHTVAGTSCLHLPGFTRRTKGFDWNRLCPEKLAAALEVAARSPHAVVLISHNWRFQTGKAGLFRDGSVLERHATVDDVIDGLAALKRELGARPLVVLGDVPGTGTTKAGLMHKLLRPRYLLDAERHSTIANIAHTPRSRARPIEALNRRLREAASRSGYIYLDPLDVLCDETRCRNLDDSGRLLYSDPAHLSVAGSRYVIGHLADALRDVVHSPARASPDPD